MIKNVPVPHLVSEDQRKRNSKAQATRDRWRERYAELSLAIRNAKRDLHNNAEFTHFYHIHLQLDGLRMLARDMMNRRNEIGQVLRDTSYAYVPKEEVVKVKMNGATVYG